MSLSVWSSDWSQCGSSHFHHVLIGDANQIKGLDVKIIYEHRRGIEWCIMAEFMAPWDQCAPLVCTSASFEKPTFICHFFLELIILDDQFEWMNREMGLRSKTTRNKVHFQTETNSLDMQGSGCWSTWIGSVRRIVSSSFLSAEFRLHFVQNASVEERQMDLWPWIICDLMHLNSLLCSV